MTFWLPRKPYEEPDAIQQVGVFDLMDSRGLTSYNELLAKNGHTVRIDDIKERFLQEKKTFDRQGVEVDYSPAQMLVCVTYWIRPAHHLQAPPPPPALLAAFDLPPDAEEATSPDDAEDEDDAGGDGEDADGDE